MTLSFRTLYSILLLTYLLTYCWPKHNAAKSDTKVNHSIRVSSVIGGTYTRSFWHHNKNIFVSEKYEGHSGCWETTYQFSCASSAQRTVCNSEFLRTTLLQAFKTRILTNYSVYRRVTNPCLSWNFKCGSVNFWCTFLTQNQFID